MAVLEHLEPQRVFSFFEQLSAIPRGSGNSQAISDWLVAFAEARNLEVHRDKMNNVIIIKEATSGYENGAPIIIQGHTDMVCEKAPDCTKDMETEGLDLAVDGDVIYAKGTTLGADNGIAVAMALAILDDPDMQHPRVEAVFTVDEEIGLLGAADIDVTPLKGRMLLNLDSEDEGVFTVSCAGGNMTVCTLPVARTAFDGAALTVKVSGLLGGHSGIEIDKGRANANMLMGRVLHAMQKATDLRLINAEGGQKDNAIPCDCVASVKVADAAAARAAAQDIEAALQNEYSVTDPAIVVTVSEGADALPFDKESTDKAICLLTCLPNGIEEMSADVDGLVQTSLNLGVLRTYEDRFVESFCVRSSIKSQKRMICERLDILTRQLGGKTEIFGDYPGWQYRHDSALRDLLIEVFTEQYGHEPWVEAIHAGLECGMFCDKIEDLDCVSVGPDLTSVHTFREQMHIASVQRVTAMVVELLRRMK